MHIVCHFFSKKCSGTDLFSRFLFLLNTNKQTNKHHHKQRIYNKVSICGWTLSCCSQRREGKLITASLDVSHMFLHTLIWATIKQGRNGGGGRYTCVLPRHAPPRPNLEPEAGSNIKVTYTHIFRFFSLLIDW